jgi:hypothetical protein
VCRPKEEIDSYIKTGFIGINIVDTLLDLEDYENPIKRNFNTPYTRSSIDLYKDYQIYVRKGYVRTDRGWIYPIIDEKPFLSVAQEKEIVLSIRDGDPGDPMFGSFNLRVNSLQQVFERKYDKIQDVLSNIGKGMIVIKI